MRKIYFLLATFTLLIGTSFAQNNVFVGSDFEDFDAFQSNLNQYGLQAYATQGKGKGVNGSNSLNITTTAAGNDYVFTANLGSVVSAKPKEISFWINGTANGKSISLNVYKLDGTYYSYNLENLTTNSKFQSAPNNQYAGSINTNGQWVKVTLDLTNKTDLNISNLNSSFFALKIGREGVYSIDVDNFELWDETMNTYDLTVSKPISNTLWTNEATFNVKDKTIVEIYNINGQLIKTFEIKGVQTVNVSNLVKGIYIVKTTSNGKTSTQKVVKK